ncbi:hypothetical protein G436_3253 [Leptospira interrogans serovar Hardjo str. Norma]|uniref:Uncharacterized protein n=1 Tax=Leptospira interrogans serovar Hardjo str. Norma TaxID=1279460 RepID=A0A0M3TM88_LEPIR|nr:hypothetical protein G436_3253 [Leptospira interrogans serovar Hardjo str. Norma]
MLLFGSVLRYKQGINPPNPPKITAKIPEKNPINMKPM